MKTFLLLFHRERQEQLLGYRKRGPKPKHLLLQVITLNVPQCVTLRHEHFVRGGIGSREAHVIFDIL